MVRVSVCVVVFDCWCFRSSYADGNLGGCCDVAGDHASRFFADIVAVFAQNEISLRVPLISIYPKRVVCLAFWAFKSENTCD